MACDQLVIRTVILHHPYSVLCSWILVDCGGSSSEAWELKDVLLEWMPDSMIAEEVLARSTAGAVFPLTVLLPFDERDAFAAAEDCSSASSWTHSVSSATQMQWSTQTRFSPTQTSLSNCSATILSFCSCFLMSERSVDDNNLSPQHCCHSKMWSIFIFLPWQQFIIFTSHSCKDNEQ